jgi:hypothetical protein
VSSVRSSSEPTERTVCGVVVGLVLQDETWSKYLKEGMEADVLTWSGKVVGVQIPNTVTLQVRVPTGPAALRVAHAAMDTDTGLHVLRASYRRG